MDNKGLLQDNITFGKGMIPQVDPINLPEGAYLEATNMMRNEVGILMNECGTEGFHIKVGYTIVGVHNANNDIIICSTNGTLSEIGILNDLDQYTTIYSNTILGFNVNTRVNIEFKVDYRGDRIIYIVGSGIYSRRINLDTITPLIDFDKLTGLFLQYQLPITTPVEVSSGGKVLTGVYQFGVRLVTASNGVTGFGSISNPIPIGSSTYTANRKTYDGAPSGTISGNIIKVNCTNIDTSFTYIEPCVITYIGDANVLRINSLGKIKINNRTSLTFTYSGIADELDTILLEEVSINPTNYTSAKYVTQKDNTLILAGLTESVDTFDWQTVANSIVVSYEVETINVTEPIRLSDVGVDTAVGGSFNDYKNPLVCLDKKTYKRGEVYSFSITPISLAGVKLDAYHIPARTLAESGNIERAIFPTYAENYTYPLDFPNLDSGTVLAGNYIRYHRMPSNADTPFIYFNPQIGGSQSINILALKFTINATGWEDKVSGYIISRESRVGKETIVAQGIVKDITKVTTITGELINKYVIPPLLGDTLVAGTDKTNIGTIQDPDRIGDVQIMPTIDHLVKKDINLYYSPDVITAGNILNYTPTKIRRVLSMSNTYQWYTKGDEHLDDNSAIQGYIEPVYSASRLDEVEIANTIVNVPSFSNSLTDVPREGSNSDIINPFGIKLYARRTLECLLIKTKTNLPNSRVTTTDRFHFWNDQDSTNIQWQPHNGARTIDLYELVIDSSDYYGDIYNKEMIPIKTVLTTGGILPKVTVCYGGDIFISKYALTIKDTLPLEGTVGEYQTVPKSDLCVYFYVESTNNYNYRHHVDGKVTYFPKEPDLAKLVLGTPIASGHSEQYNRQYSAQNTIQKSYTKTIDSFVTGAFDNRIVYSETSIEGEQEDSFSTFLPSNYHDIPKQFGSITGLFLQGTDLYIHTQRALWKSFYNTLVTQATSAGEVILGNGGAFSRPSVPILTLSGGYAGCKDISASCSTPLGRFFYDSKEAKLFLLGEGMQEISNPAVFTLLREVIGDSNTVLGYDFGRKRLILSSNNLTISFKPELQSFDSLHSYSFDHFISRGLKDYVISKEYIHWFSTSIVGQYINNPIHDSSVKFASVINPSLSKRYTSAEVVLTSQSPVTKINSPWSFFKSLKMYSRERNTGVCTFKVNPSFGELETFGEILVSKINNKFRFGFAPDIVDDINTNIQDSYNLKSHSRFTDSDRLFLPDMVDNHMILEFTIDNNQQKEIKIQSLIVNFTQNIT